MDPKAIKELEILHEVSINEHINQRHLSKKLGMAAGLVNIYLKRLVHKGYIKVTGIKPRRLKYLVTPKGIAEKSRLTYEFALISYKYFKNTSDEIREKLEEMEREGVRDVVVFGTGELAEFSLLLIGESSLEVVAVVADRIEKSSYFDCPAVPKEVLGNLKFDKLIVTETDSRDSVEALLEEADIDPDKVCWLLEVPSE